jgi:hypothetical protein
MSDNGDAGTGAWDMEDMAAALPSSKDTIYQGPTFDEAKTRAREHGYGERVDYNYTQKETTRRVAKFSRCDWVATGELGVFAPRHPKLEKDLFSNEFTYGKGMHMDILENVKIEIIGENPVKPGGSVGRCRQ